MQAFFVKEIVSPEVICKNASPHPASGILPCQFKPAGKETGNKMLVFNFSEFRFPVAANIFGKEATRVKAAAGRGVDGAGDVAFQNDPFITF